MGTFVAYQKMSQKNLRKTAKESIDGITKWFGKNPKRRVCKASLWYGITCKVKRGTVKEQVDAVLKETIEKDKADKAPPPTHRFKVGDYVGVVGDCMAEFVIDEIRGDGYVATCKVVHSDHSVMKPGQQYTLQDRQVVVKLG
jgi:hypothetical protein